MEFCHVVLMDGADWSADKMIGYDWFVRCPVKGVTPGKICT